MKAEKIITPLNGYIAALLILVSAILIGYGALSANPVLIIIFAPVAIILIKGLITISPNTSKVLLLFGNYAGTIKVNGLFWINPLYTRYTYSLRARNFESEKLR